jgi:hypothetical protein
MVAKYGTIPDDPGHAVGTYALAIELLHVTKKKKLRKSIPVH